MEDYCEQDVHVVETLFNDIFRKHLAVNALMLFGLNVDLARRHGTSRNSSHGRLVLVQAQKLESASPNKKMDKTLLVACERNLPVC